MLGLYIHIPFCKHKCAYCDFCSFPAGEADRERYVAALVREIGLWAEKAPAVPVDTVFIGGGTPTLLSPKQLRAIFDAVSRHYPLSDSTEISIESNPATLTDDHLALFKEKKVTRISIGLQAAQNKLLKRIGRVHTVEQFLETFHRARQAGSWDINIDLIYHLPGQTRQDWLDTLNCVIGLEPEHISCYSLQLEEGTPLEAAVSKGRFTMSSDRNNRWMHHAAIDLLAIHGYTHYEISNFSKPGHECRHNLRYWHREPYLGLGLAAHGFLDSRRMSNPDSMADYLESLEAEKLAFAVIEELKPEDALFETVMLGLRTTAGVSWEQAMAGCAPEKRTVWDSVCESLEKQGLLQVNEGRVQLTRLGMDLSNRVFSAFMEI